jgi:hypothetical protein
MKSRKLLIAIVLVLSACGGSEKPAPEVSRRDHPISQGMTYQQFRNHEINTDSDMKAAQKRFLILDRDNNGILSPSEFNGY